MFRDFRMLTYPDINPVALDLGPLKIHWYGLMYLFGFAMAWALGNHRAKQPNSGWNGEQVSDLIFFCAEIGRASCRERV